MKELTLTGIIKSKLDRLTDKVVSLSYLGVDITSLDNTPMVAIVGTRKPTPYGKLMTEKLSEDLARAGVVIVSGLALGVDGIALQAAVRAKGQTIAVLPSGLEHIYPATNRPIAEHIIKENGAIISEYGAKHTPFKVDFLQRNRIIAALSDIVIIPEAAGHSGSLNTATHAKNMGIPVCVVPGNVTSPMSAGTNYLLKNSAFAVTEASDILKMLHINTKSQQLTLDLTGGTPQETLILQTIARGINDSSELQTHTKLETVHFQTAITMLEIQGRIASDESGNWRLI